MRNSQTQNSGRLKVDGQLELGRPVRVRQSGCKQTVLLNVRRSQCLRLALLWRSERNCDPNGLRTIYAASANSGRSNFDSISQCASGLRTGLLTANGKPAPFGASSPPR